MLLFFRLKFTAFALGITEQPAFLGKKELFGSRLAAAFFNKLGVISIDRGSADIAAVKKCFSALKNGKKLVIFPEGTRSKSGEMAEAKAGAGMFALRTGVPVIPIYIQPGKRPFKTSMVIVGKPYVPQQEDRRGNRAYLAAADQIMEKIAELKPADQAKKLSD